MFQATQVRAEEPQKRYKSANHAVASIYSNQNSVLPKKKLTSVK